MADNFQRLFTISDPQPLSLNAQAALGPVRIPERSQFALLARHFVERFFNHETASPDGDAKTRMVQIACSTGLPGLMVAIYLWPVYHPIKGWPPGHPSAGGPPPYWLQVNHHLFFVLYSFVAMGIATVFEWDLFFPDLLDISVLETLPIAARKVFLARVAAISLFTSGLLFDANVGAIFVLPAATDPPRLMPLLAGHVLAVGAGGLFAALLVLALEGTLLAAFGERWFRKLSLVLQGLFTTSLFLLLLLFPVFSSAVPVLLKSGSGFTEWFPPFWFLGIYQRLLEGPAALPIFGRLAEHGCSALALVTGLAIVTYPLAYRRRVRGLVEGARTRVRRNWLERPVNRLLHWTIARTPVRRAVFHFIGQTLLRVPRYRIYLVLYGGVGVSVVAASLLRITVVHQHVQIGISADGSLAAIGIVVFWAIAGMRMAFVSSGNQRGSWVYRIVHGRPPHFTAAMEMLLAGQNWVLLWSGVLTLGACLLLRSLAPLHWQGWQAQAAQMLMACGMCLLLTDAFFLNVTIVAFTGEPAREPSNLAFSALKYFTFFPLVAAAPVVIEPWIEQSLLHLAVGAAVVMAAHLVLRAWHRAVIREHSNLPSLEADEEEFLMKLGLTH
jgi:hypothetical protein